MTAYNRDIFQRAELLLGQQRMERIAAARVIIFGVGGVGSWCAETLVRSGIGHLTMVDGDEVVASNINRQLMATTATIGQPKVEVLRERLQLINPDADIRTVYGRFNADTAESFRLSEYDYVIDAIDSLNDKALLINTVTRLPGRESATGAQPSETRYVQLFSSMGAARKFDPTRIRIAEFWRVAGDPLARTLRHKFKQSGIYPARKFLCVYSDEVLPNQPVAEMQNAECRMQNAQTANKERPANGTLAHITAIFGNLLASLVLKHICA